MKKIVLTIIVLAVFCISSFTSYAGEPFKKGPIAGWHYSDILKDGLNCLTGHLATIGIGIGNGRLIHHILKGNSLTTKYRGAPAETRRK